jgi:hypothetical protein
MLGLHSNILAHAPTPTQLDGRQNIYTLSCNRNAAPEGVVWAALAVTEDEKRF